MGLVSRLCTSGLLLSKGNLVSIGDMNDLIRIYLQTDVREKAVVELPIVNNERAHFTRIGLQNDYGDWINEFSLGDNITVIIEFDIPETEDDQVMLAMQIETSNGYHIANVIDKDSLFIQGYQRGINKIRISVHDVRLYPDTYYLSFWIGDRASYPIQHVTNLLKFSIINGGKLTQRNLPQDTGLIFFTPDWEVV